MSRYSDASDYYKKGLLIPPLVELALIDDDEMFGYVIKRLDTVTCLRVAASTRHIIYTNS